jgi:BNR/Asp-box repeat
MRPMATTLALLALLPVCASADQPAWQGMLGDLVKIEKAGFGGLCGIAVDHETGTIWINVSDRGFYRSDDQARTFKRVSDQQPKGRTESPGCFMLDPTGKTRRLATALVYGSPISVSSNGGETWKSLHAKSAHVDWCALDWTDPGTKFVLALKHEAGGLLLVSHDGGTTFAEVGKGYGPGWVFDGETAVVAQAKSKDRPKPNLMRTTDGGKTWQPCGAYIPVGVNSAQALPKWRGGMLYWLVEGALIASDDRGATWKKVADVKDGRYGPVFGKDTKQLFVLIGAGVIESTDGGASWSKPIAPPKDLKGVGGLTWLEYDPKNDVLYLLKMGSDLFKLARGN